MPDRDVWKHPRKGDVVFSPPIGGCTVKRASKTSVTLTNTMGLLLNLDPTRRATRARFVELGALDGAEMRHVQECWPGCSTVTDVEGCEPCVPCRRMRAEADGL